MGGDEMSEITNDELRASAARLFDFFLDDLKENLPTADLPTAMTVATMFIAALLIQTDEAGAFEDSQQVFDKALATIMDSRRLRSMAPAGNA
jgi:hypothetical protein